MEVKRDFLSRIPLLLDIPITDTADHLPLDKFFVLGLLSDDPHGIVEFRNLCGYIVTGNRGNILDRLANQIPRFECHNLVCPVLHDMGSKFIPYFTITIQARLLALVVVPQVFDFTDIQQMRFVCPFNHFYDVIGSKSIGRGKNHSPSEHHFSGINRFCSLFPFLLGVLMVFIHFGHSSHLR